MDEGDDECLKRTTNCDYHNVIITTKRLLMMVVMRMVMTMNNMDGQGCGKCLFCLKISALCECTEEDKVEDIFLFQFFLAPTCAQEHFALPCSNKGSQKLFDYISFSLILSIKGHSESLLL